MHASVRFAGSIPAVVRQIFQLVQCGYTLRVTRQTHSTPKYIPPLFNNPFVRRLPQKITIVALLFCSALA